jgi:hypothetical protein
MAAQISRFRKCIRRKMIKSFSKQNSGPDDRLTVMLRYFSRRRSYQAPTGTPMPPT